MQSVMPFEFNLCLCFFGDRQIRWKVAWKPLTTNTKHPDFVLSAEIAMNFELSSFSGYVSDHLFPGQLELLD